LFDLVRGKHPKVDTVIVTGGRDSGKSFTCSLGICDAMVNYNHRVLYTRYTLTSAKDSIIPDFNEKIAALNYENYLHVTQDRINCIHNKGKVVFKGFKTSQGNQTAALKSLKDFSMLVCEEMEEYPSYDEWDKVQLSIRSTDVQAINICILNPATKKHWIYREFFENKGVKAGFNGIKDNVLYIHTTYLDLGEKYIAPKNWRKYEAARIVYEKLEKLSKSERLVCDKKDVKLWKYYKYTVLGGWMESAAGVIIEDYDTYDKLPEGVETEILGLDFGYSNDPTALIEVNVTPEDLYLKQLIYETGLLNNDLADRIHLVTDGAELYIVADHSRGDLIDDLNRIAGEKGYNFRVLRCKKGKGSVKDGLDKMKDKNIYIHKDSKDLLDEADHYHAIEVINSKGETVYHIVDKDNHAFDAARYAYNKFY